MPRPVVAIVGRPNVGKSTLFNALVGSRIAIEADTPGATRDRLLYPLTIDDRSFDLVDTGGIGMTDVQRLEALVERQIELGIAAADLVLFLVDGRDGLTPMDEDIARRLRRAGKRVLLSASKIDTDALEHAMPSYHALGFGDAVPVSAKQHRGLADLEEALLAALPPRELDEEPVILHELLKIAFVGRRNVGKSTLINALCGSERVMVSDVPGTTRDSVDVLIERDGRKFVAIDTAGLRKPGQMDDSLEFFGHLRAERAVRRCDVAVLMLDATEEIGRVDKRLGSFIVAEHKPCLIALSKWDLALEKNPNVTVGDFHDYINQHLPGLHFSRLAGVSGKDGTNVWGLVECAESLARQAAKTVKTAALNGCLVEAQQRRAPKTIGGKRGRIYYGTQVGVSPPTFLLFCNNPSHFDDQYKRYLSGRMREALGFPEVPLRLVLRASQEKQIGRYGE